MSENNDRRLLASILKTLEEAEANLESVGEKLVVAKLAIAIEQLKRSIDNTVN